MCQYEVVSVSSRQCQYASNSTGGHIWHRYTYHLCDDAADNGYRCEEAEATEPQNEAVIGSTTLLACRVCDRLSNAIAARDQAVARAEAEYTRAEQEAYRETRELLPLREPSDRRRKGKSKGDKRRGRESRSNGRHGSNSYYDDNRRNDEYDRSQGQERMH